MNITPTKVITIHLPNRCYCLLIQVQASKGMDLGPSDLVLLNLIGYQIRVSGFPLLDIGVSVYRWSCIPVCICFLILIYYKYVISKISPSPSLFLPH